MRFTPNKELLHAIPLLEQKLANPRASVGVICLANGFEASEKALGQFRATPDDATLLALLKQVSGDAGELFVRAKLLDKALEAANEYIASKSGEALDAQEVSKRIEKILEGRYL